jgi:hypothetical protein
MGLLKCHININECDKNLNYYPASLYLLYFYFQKKLYFNIIILNDLKYDLICVLHYILLIDLSDDSSL